jgi:hypothetical protein
LLRQTGVRLASKGLEVYWMLRLIGSPFLQRWLDEWQSAQRRQRQLPHR